ncbi:MAG: amidohydrolase family protein [Alphaproteobacteria bacterium]
MIIDTHQHFWELERGDYRWLTSDLEVLYRDFLPCDLGEILGGLGVGGTIAVQAAESEEESEYLLALAARYEWILGVIGWVDLAGLGARAGIARLGGHRKLVGLRPMIQGMADDGWMLGDSLIPAIEEMVARDLTFDALVYPRHLGNLRLFLERYPGLRVVIDHCAKPRICDGEFELWAEAMSEVAGFGNVFCKLSGLVTEAGGDWRGDDLRLYVSHIFEIFGSDRLLFGSDWPVVNLASSYGDWFGLVLSFLEGVSSSERDSIMGDNAFLAYPRLRA